MKRCRGVEFVFLITAFVLTGTVAVSFFVGTEALDLNQTVLQERADIGLLNGLLSTLKDAETGQRGYLLTGERPYLQPYDNAVVSLRKIGRAVGALSTSGSIPAETGARIQTLTRDLLAQLQATIDLRDQRGMEAALAVIRTGRSKATMDALRATVRAAKATKETELDHFIRRIEAITTLRTAAWTLCVIGNLAFLAWAYRRMVVEIALRDAANAEATRQRDLVNVTLASIGDGVIVADAVGHVTFMNREAERTTQWTALEAQGQALASVFRIVNEGSRLPVESPVDKVLRMGTVVGLANHTVLLGKDGREIPVDDSGAPILRRDGSIQGVVLVFRDITERKLAEEQIVRAKTTAENANRAKSDFLANMSHEIRTPLTAIMGFAELIQDPAITAAERYQFAETLRRNGRHLVQLIDDILDLSRVEVNKLTMDLVTCCLPDVMADVVAILGNQATDKGIWLRVNAVGDVPNLIVSDPLRLKQVLVNIIGNGLKFTAQGGVDVTITRGGLAGTAHVLVFTVTDSGKGMDPEEQARIFSTFSQGDSSSVRRYGGTGLGLALSRRLAQALGGDVVLTASAPGAGSVFTVTVTTAEMAGHYVRPDAARRRGSEVSLWGGSDPASLRGILILVVEDAPDNQVLISQILRRSGAQVVLAENGLEALDKALSSDSDVILMDLQMPVCDGYKATSELRRLGFKKPILALSAAAMCGDREGALAVGCDDHVTKPITAGPLVAKIAHHVRAFRSLHPTP